MNDCEFCENQHSESNPQLVSAMGELQHKMAAHNAAEHFVSFMKTHTQKAIVFLQV